MAIHHSSKAVNTKSLLRCYSISLHHAYDCRIDLQPGMQISFGKLQAMLQPKLEASGDYLQGNLTEGVIHKSTPLAGALVLFIKKKEGKLQHCIDYQALSQITVRNQYPLPLIPEMLDHIGTAGIFTNLDPGRGATISGVLQQVIHRKWHLVPIMANSSIL